VHKTTVGLGCAGEADFGQFGLPSNARARADLLDESLHVIAGLCSGEPFEYQGRDFTIKETLFRPAPVQSHIPVWIAGYWPNKRPMRRAARWHGAFPAPQVVPTEDGFAAIQFPPEEVSRVRSYIEQYRSSQEPFDLVISHALPLDDSSAAAEEVRRYGQVTPAPCHDSKNTRRSTLHGSTRSPNGLSKICDRAKIRDKQVATRPIYAAIGATLHGEKHILGLWATTGGEGSPVLAAVMPELKNRGVGDVCMVGCDGFKGLAEAIATTWPRGHTDACRALVAGVVSLCPVCTLA
jgi:alkanesulfonate monooxygenase SsuD/methylene tetrahydromethanopterin reductase-like flavin-dependent oxidoreductase (luciferase family)